jgi:hypothetical protein
VNWQISYDDTLHIVRVKVRGIILAANTAEMAVQGVAFARAERRCHRLARQFLSQVG